MKKSFNITNSDLQYMIHEVCRRITSIINESVKEGGAYGHMYHPYEIDDYTFGNYKELVRDLFHVNIERFSEKLDGMNIFATVDNTGTVRFARNKGHIKNEFGGMGLEDIKARWCGSGSDPTIFEAYSNAYKLFTDVIHKLKNPVEFFNGDGYRIYANCEVIDPVHPNVIPYLNMGKVLSFHGLVAMSADGQANNVDLPEDIYDQKMAVLEKLMPDVKSQYGTPQITPDVAVKIKENCEDAIGRYISLIDNIEQKAGVNDDTTIIEYRAKLLPEWLQEKGYDIFLQDQTRDYFIRRWVYGEKTPNIKQFAKTLKDGGYPNANEVYDAAKAFEGDGKKGTPLDEAFNTIMKPIEVFFYSLGNEVIKGVEGYSNAGKESQVLASYAEQLKDTQEMLAAADDPYNQMIMTRCLDKLAELGNEYNAMEGIVFNYKGKTLKLTGSFAALNRAINIRLQLGKKQ